MSCAPRIGSRSNLRLCYSANERVTVSQQWFKWHGGLGWFAHRRGVIAACWAEATHLIPLLRAPTWQILSVERRRAASESVGACFPARAR